MPKMKTALWFIVCLLLVSGNVLGDEVDERLPETTPPSVKDGVRAMHRQGLNLDNAISLTDAMVNHRFQKAQILEAQRILVDAHQNGLPTDPLNNKAFEGISKQIAPAQILNAMSNVHKRYAFAHESVVDITPKGEVRQRLANTLAEGLTAGLEPTDASGVIDTLSTRTPAATSGELTSLAEAALNLMRDLARLGVTSSLTTSLVDNALRQGYTVVEMRQMHRSFVAQAQRGAAQSLAQSYSQSIQRGEKPDGAGGPSDGGSSSPGGPGGGPGPGGPGGSGTH
jgi:hypothetical protein